MRIKSIDLSWFRGAADRATLEVDGKSIVIYGPNGSGKSSFVDAVEYVLGNGKIGHLSHEYSGRKQEKGIINTHIPPDTEAKLHFRFLNDSTFTTTIKSDGRSMFASDGDVDIQQWDYKRTVLRQDEVAAFISARKGDKYSALLPLLDLGPLEVAAENLRQLVRTIVSRPAYSERKTKIVGISRNIEQEFGNQPEIQIWNLIGGIYKKYLQRTPDKEVSLRICGELSQNLAERIANLSSEHQMYYRLLDLRRLEIPERIKRVREISFDLVNKSEPFIEERLQILHGAARLVDKLEGSTDVTCPACGQRISTQALQAHVLSEQGRLREIISQFGERRVVLSRLVDSIKLVRETFAREEFASWLDDADRADIRDALRTIAVVDLDRLRTTCSEEDLSELEGSVSGIVRAVEVETSNVPPDIQTLSADKQKVNAAEALLRSRDTAAAVAKIDRLIEFVSELEKEIRLAIRYRSQMTIEKISGDIECIWSILHPGEQIEAVKLYVPEGSDKAIDIGLKFYGVTQESPRLTLSEGHRNSLGLSIFLAMSKMDKKIDIPLFLDDVVVSLDRNHRGMVAEVLEEEFHERQVIVLTHDREWYTELRQQLPQSSWRFNALMPWREPGVGIGFSSKASNFDQARANLKERPDAAGNDARKIMDIELALVAEKLRLRMTYLRGERNDFRTANDYIGRMIGDAPKCLQKRKNDAYGPYDEPVGAWSEAQRLLISWGNRGSHSFNLVGSEPEKLVGACEKALDYLRCGECGTGVWRADDVAGEAVQCRCGQIRWRYGKG